MLYVWLVTARSITAVAPALTDDGLFVSQAEAILGGRWLGPSSDLTLVKGPGYPLWLALVHVSGAPLILAQACLYVATCALLVLATRPIVSRTWARWVLFTCVLFNPATWAGNATTRVVREGIYPSLTVLVLALAAGLALRLRDDARSWTAWAVSLGIAGSAFIMTREEGAWLLPSIALLVAFAVRWHWRRAIAAVLLTTAVGLVPTLTVAAINRNRYGVFTTCETTSSYFQRAYGALARVKAERWNPYVPVPRDVRLKVAAVSPAFRVVAGSIRARRPGLDRPGLRERRGVR